MYTIEQAERIAAEYLRQLTADWDNETALFPDKEYKAQKGTA
ncbi:hypothetical protein ABZ923_40540 [Streptomyces sp. NPDC046881]